jgi:redox-sensitive bicupin YhaK (pirin superfamily)
MKNVLRIHRGESGHWVGDGFPVRTIFSYQDSAEQRSPFLLLDYAGPAEFPPSDGAPRGVGVHPHRGFETVTIVYQGDLEHRDSAGNHGSIGPGDVQWMTAGSGIMHEERHSNDFTKRGGTLEMAQLWVNLPAEFKMSAPRYQSILAGDIPSIGLEGGAGTIRVIAGEFQGAKGPARTFTPINVWNLKLHSGHRVTLQVPDGYTTALAVLKGEAVLSQSESIGEVQLAIFERAGDTLMIEAVSDANILLLNGEPIDEPIVGYGPFVMNAQDEIEEAFEDLRKGTLVR